MLNSLIIYNYNDMSWFFLGGISKIDISSSLMLNHLRSVLGAILSNNIFIVSSLILSMSFTFFMFKKIGSNLTEVLSSILFSFCVYFQYRVISLTPGLYFVFLFPLIVLLLLKDTKPLLLGLVTFIILSFSNYYGFFCFVLVYLWYLFDLISKKINFRKFVKKILLFSIPVFIGILIFFFPLLKSNLTFSNEYTRENSEKNSTERTVIYRPIEDWYNLSFRPWYFFIPPKSSIFFGDLSKNIHDRIKFTGYYLADDYMEEEMAGSYMGWHFLLGMGVVAVLLLLKKYKNKEYPVFKTVYENKEMILRSFFIIFCILLISGPPSFTIHGIEIYTPTYLLYYVVPVFRTLVRWAVVIYLFVLIINSFLVQDLYNLMKTKLQKTLFILTFITLNFVIFAIKIPVINIEKPPVEIAYVKEKYPQSVSYAVYPKGDYYSIFWIISHEDKLINPVNYVNYETGFDANEFSKNLITEKGIQEFLNQNPEYLIYYPENISDDDLEKISKINPDIRTRDDIYGFFEQRIGEGVKVGESIVFEVRSN